VTIIYSENENCSLYNYFRYIYLCNIKENKKKYKDFLIFKSIKMKMHENFFNTLLIILSAHSTDFSKYTIYFYIINQNFSIQALVILL